MIDLAEARYRWAMLFEGLETMGRDRGHFAYDGRASSVVDAWGNVWSDDTDDPLLVPYAPAFASRKRK